MPLLNPARAWHPRGRQMVLWHGTTTDDVKNILAGVDPSAGRLAVDFGRGFYTTTIKRQARHWAWERYFDRRSAKKSTPGNAPAVLRFEVDRYELALLQVMMFVGGSYSNESFWSLVQHCRQSVEPVGGAGGVIHHHFGPKVFDGGDWYDVVCGPVAAFWQQRSSMADADQISFHTPNAVALLNKCIVAAPPAFVFFRFRERLRQKGENYGTTANHDLLDRS